MSLNIKTSQGLKRINTVHIAKPQIETKDVNFYDYDGTLIKSYSKNSFLKLNSLPANPTHEGLTAQGWNWSLSDAKDYVRDYGKLNIGQMYITSDGKTRIYIHLEEGRLNPELNLKFTEDGSFTVDWGDGTTPDTVSDIEGMIGTIAHTYVVAGDYVITVTVDSGKVSIVGAKSYARILKKPNKTDGENRVYNNCIKQIELGSNITNIETYAFYDCYSLTSITIPNSITSIGSYAFFNCYALASVTIPSEITTIGTYTFNCCYSLISVAIPSEITSIEDFVFVECRSLTSITIPSKITRIGNYVFKGCYSLTLIIIPSNVTSLGSNALAGCYLLTSVNIPNSTTYIGSTAFNSCYSLTSITIPDNVGFIGDYAFCDCSALASITMSSQVTSISNNTFQFCYSLISITIPNSVKSIGNNAFSGCSGLGFIKFERRTPPTIANSNAFSSLPTDCIIYVPEGSLSLYTHAANYPSSSTYTYVEY